MRDQLTAFDLHFLLRELRVLVGSRLDKVYQGRGERSNDFLFQFNKEGKILLRLKLPSTLFLTREKPVYDAPGQFATILRKRVGNARVVSVEQRGFDRILELHLEHKENYTLLIQLMPPGKLFLLDATGAIVASYARDGQRKGDAYEAPRPPFDTIHARPEELEARLRESNKESIVKALAVDLGLGGEYAEELCARAAIDKNAPLHDVELAKVVETLQGLLEHPLEAHANGGVYPIPMVTREGERAESFSAAIEQHVSQALDTLKPLPSKKQKAAEVVKQQEAALEGLRRKAEENQRKGELIYEHYTELRGLLEAARKREPLPEKIVVAKDGTLTVDL